MGPRSFFQSSSPRVSKQKRPSEPKRATTWRPSVAGVELQWVALVWRATLGALQRGAWDYVACEAAGVPKGTFEE